LTTDTVKGRPPEPMLKKALNRERIAHCKLERLKSRFERIQEEMLASRAEREVFRDQCERLKEEVATLKDQKSHLEQESSMWRTQLFERMELLDQAKDRLAEMEQHTESLLCQADQAEQTQMTSHRELKRRDRERKEFELKIEELQSAQDHSRCETQEMLEALTDAKRAIDSLQRSNDYYQREVVGLKSIGASVTEKLTKMTQQRDRYRQRLNSRGDELRLEQGQSAHLLDEVERLKDELYETRGKLMTYQIEDDVREVRQAGADKANRAAEQKYADFPAESVAKAPEAPASLLSKATKKFSGWFRLSEN
jgi:chromosome segregation ATPase